MSDRYQGGIIKAVPAQPTAASASGIWTLEQQSKAAATNSWPTPGYSVPRSLRFNATDSAYLSKTPGTAGNRYRWTWSGWIKRSNLGSDDNWNFQMLAACPDVSNYAILHFYIDAIRFQTYSTVVLETRAVYRDVSAWYHVVLVMDTLNSASEERVKLYVNGLQVTDFATTNYPSSGTQYSINNTVQHRIGSSQVDSVYSSGYLANVDFVDGSYAPGPQYFGQFNNATGVWEPKQYTGNYGTTGYHLDFADNSSTTALGYDTSGNGNNWSATNFSVTAGVNNDSFVDSPTRGGNDTGAGGEVTGNYPILNVAIPGISPASVVSDGALKFVNTYQFMGTIALPTSGKWYAECTMTTVGGTSGGIIIGIGTMYNNGASKLGLRAQANTSYNDVGATVDSASYSNLSNGDIVGIAYDADNGTMDMYINNTLAVEFSNVPTTYNSSRYTFGSWGDYSTDAGYWNFGQRPFAYPAPSGFKCLCTTNLEAPTLSTGTNDFNATLWVGDGSDTNATTTGPGFAPDLVWIKNFTDVSELRHCLYDSLRGPSTGSVSKSLIPNQNLSQGSNNDNSTYGYLSAFTETGFDYVTGSNGSTSYTNANQQGYISWNWRAGGSSGATNNDGSIATSVSANTTAGISVMTWTGTSANATIGHGLGVAPSWVVVKNLTNNYDWTIYHSSAGATKYLILNSSSYGAITDSTAWNNTAPTSSVITVGSSAWVNESTANMVTYAFAQVDGFSAFGRYTGNGAQDGAFAYTGFRPAFVMLKRDGVGSWYMLDNSRSHYNVNRRLLLANSASVEIAADILDFLSNGFKLRYSGTDGNGSGSTIYYMAFAENPFKYALAK